MTRFHQSIAESATRVLRRSARLRAASLLLFAIACSAETSPTPPPAPSAPCAPRAIALSSADEDRLAQEALAIPLSTWRYEDNVPGPRGRRLGFVIEDTASDLAVHRARGRVDLEGTAGLLLATFKAQQRRIERLEAELAHCAASAPAETEAP